MEKNYILIIVGLIIAILMFPFGHVISLIDNVRKRKSIFLSVCSVMLGYLFVYIPINYFIKGSIIVENYVALVVLVIFMMLFLFLGYRSKNMFQKENKKS